MNPSIRTVLSKLESHTAGSAPRDMREAFASDPERALRFSVRLDDLQEAIDQARHGEVRGGEDAHRPAPSALPEPGPGALRPDAPTPEAIADHLRALADGDHGSVFGDGQLDAPLGAIDLHGDALLPSAGREVARQDRGAQLLTESGTGGFYIKMNTTKPPLDDPECRLALVNAFDYASSIKMIAVTPDVSQGSPATGAIPVGMLGSNPPEDALTSDMDAAKKHMEACATAPEDFNLEVSWIAEVPLEERFALLMQANFAQLGVKSEIKKMPWALFAEQVSKPENTPHISQLFVNAVTGDPDTLLYGMYFSDAAGTWQSPEYLDDAEVDELLTQGRTITDEAGRAEAYKKLNERLMEVAPTIYGYDRQSVFAASERVKVPALSDPSKAFGLDGMGFTFRLMEMQEGS